MGKINREVIILFNRIKEPGVNKKELMESCNHYLELMSYCGVPPEIRKKLHTYSFQPTKNKEKIINIVENTLISILEKT